MRKIERLFLVVMTVTALAVHSAGAESMIQINGDQAQKSTEEILQMVEEATEDYYQDQAVAEELSGEISREDHDDGFGGAVSIYTLNHGGNAMRFLMEKKGDPDENGRYPLYITLHGGGEWTPEDNDGQWYGMFGYYREAGQNGIYIACRGIMDTWDLHFRPESYPLYDRLIQAMIRLYKADPNRVYLLGFSAGGDGVYQITPRMTDRFAAANMSSGHPNGISLRNLMNCPFSIQVGVRDYYSEDAMRCIRGAEMDQVLNDYHDQTGYGYEHQVLVRVPAGHTFDDYNDITLAGEEYADRMNEIGAEVLESPAEYANPDIVQPLLNSFLKAYQSATIGADALGEDVTELIRQAATESIVDQLGYEDPEAIEQMIAFMTNQGDTQTGGPSVMEMSFFSDGIVEAFDEKIREILTEEFQLEITRVNGSAIHYVNQFSRNPAPPVVVWDLTTRATSRDITSFYWLRADPTVNQGEIRVLAGDENTIVVTPENVNGDFSILIHPELIDAS
ncbi:MAG: hypothetical protein IKE25_10705 [Clostridia bacterium]|nr:hypothetical protein [Clostridia bacterium]